MTHDCGRPGSVGLGRAKPGPLVNKSVSAVTLAYSLISFITVEAMAQDTVQQTGKALTAGTGIDWSIAPPLLITATLTMIGWFAVHQFNARRDRINKRRDQRVQYLVEAFRRLDKSAGHPNIIELNAELRSVMTDIHLFGTEEQIRKIVEAVKSLTQNREAKLDDLLSSLRNDLRRELELPEVAGTLWHLWMQPLYAKADIVVPRLLDAFHSLVKVAQNGNAQETTDDLQMALTEIQLFGSEGLIQTVTPFVKELQDTGQVPIGKLLNSFRNHLRQQLDLPEISSDFVVLRKVPQARESPGAPSH